MSFIYPQFLFGLFALAIPIIIHLFNFRRAKKIYFSNNLFLLNIKKASSTKQQLKQLLVLLARLLFLFFLVMTFAQPFLPASEKEIQSNRVIIYLDNSYSMSNAADEEHSAYEMALHHIESIIGIYPQNTEITLLTNDFAPFSNKPKNKNEVIDLITEINLTGVSRSAEDILTRIRPAGQRSGNADVYWISDFQKSSFEEIERIGMDTLDNYFLVPIGFDQMSNVYVDSVFLTNPFVIKGEKNELNVILRNDGNEAVSDLLIKFFLNGFQSANASIDINAYGTSTISFDIGFQLDRYNTGYVSFEDFPVVFDNEFYFTLTLADRTIITEIKSTDSTTVIEKVFGNQDLFDFRSFNSNNVDYNALQASNLIILNEIEMLEETLRQRILDLVNHSSDMVVIPSPETEPGSFEGFGFRLIHNDDSTRAEMPMASLDLRNPFFSDIFETENSQFEMPQAVREWDILGFNESLINFRDGKSFLAIIDRKQKTYVLSAPLKNNFTNFSSHAIFVPVMYRLAMLSKSEFSRLYYSLDESVIEVKADSLDGEGLVRLANADNELVPGYRISGKELFLELPKDQIMAGLYSLTSSGKFIGTLAFNEAKSESRMEQLPIEKLESLAEQNSHINLFNTKGIDNFDKVIKEKYLGIPLWRYTLILALIFLLAEILLIRFL